MIDDVARLRTRWLGLVLVLAGGVLAAGWVVLARVSAPSDGTAVHTASRSWQPNGLVVVEVAGVDNPLRPGDLVTAINGRSWSDAADAGHQKFRRGDRVVYQVVRDGQPMDVVVTLRSYPLTDFVRAHAFTVPYLVLMFLVPAFVVLRRPRDPAARTLYAMAVLLLLSVAGYPLGTQIIDVAQGRVWIAGVAECTDGLLWGALLHFSMVFPERWPVLVRRPKLALLAYALPFLLYGAALTVGLPTAVGLDRVWLLMAVSVPAASVYPVLVAITMVAGYRMAPDRFARQRMRWVSYAFGLAAVSYIFLGRLPELLTGQPLVSWDVQSLAFLPFPVALGFAVLRYRLFDIQIILRRSLVYGLVTSGLMLAYLGVVTVLNGAFDIVTDRVPVLVAAVVALAFSPTRSWIRRVVSRLVYGARDDPYEVLRQLGMQLESATSTEAVLARLVETLVRTLRLSYAAVEIIGLDMRAASYGTVGQAPQVVALVHRGEQIGQLVLDPGPNREPFGPSDQRLLDGLSRQVSATAHSVLLTASLHRSLERTVTVLEEERRRLRRDIHDGLGPTLASAVMRLDLGRSLMHGDPGAADKVLAGLADTQRQALVDVRRLVEGLRPTILDHLGLVAALREQVDRLAGRMNVTLTAAEDLEPLPAAVEVAVYRIVSEALTNVVRHAGATTCVIRLRRDGDLHVEIRDNGRGLPGTYRPGVGLTNIRERCTELGGSVEFASEPGQGTTVRCHLPVTNPEP